MNTPEIGKKLPKMPILMNILNKKHFWGGKMFVFKFFLFILNPKSNLEIFKINKTLCKNKCHVATLSGTKGST